MAVLRRGRGVAVDDLRAALAAHLRAELAGREHMRPASGRVLAQLDAGEPVELPGWLLWRWAPQVRREPLVRVEPDGTVTPIG